MLSVLACFMSVGAYISYRHAVLKCLTCLHACVFGVLVYPIFFTFEKVNFKNPYIEKLVFIERNVQNQLEHL